MRTLWCRWPDCQIGYASVAGDLPTVCPNCGRGSRWTTEMPIGAKMPPPGDEPTHRYEVTFNDARFLRSIRVDPEVQRS